MINVVTEAELEEAFTNGKLEMEESDYRYCLGYRYNGKFYVKIYELKSTRPDLYGNI